MAWEIDAGHSHAHFTVRQGLEKPIRGRFTSVKGYLYTDGENLMHSWVDIQADAGSIATGNAKRDEYLRSRRFLDVERYPTISFQSTRVEHSVGKIYRLGGDLSLHGVIRPFMFSVEFDEHEGSSGDRRATLTASSRLRCSDYGLIVREKLDQAIPEDLTTIALHLTLTTHSSLPHSRRKGVQEWQIPPQEDYDIQAPV